MQKVIDRHGFADFRELHAWSVQNPDSFWSEAWDDLGIIGTKGQLPSTGSGFLQKRWFPDASLNIAETLLAGDGQLEVIVSYPEDESRRSLTRDQLRSEVGACAAALRECGVSVGDRVVAWMPNVPETAVFALAALSIGAVVSTASPDFGALALIDRFGQIEPKVLLAATGYRYGGKKFDLGEKLNEVIRKLSSLEKVVLVGESEFHSSWDSWLEPHRGKQVVFEQLPFDHPGFVLFSSGTTGKPKCIVHSAGGVLLKVLSEQGHQMDIQAGDRVLYSTTCGWMMWNWLLCALGRRATIVLVDGSVGYPNLERLWEIAGKEKVTLLGLSAALIEAYRQANLLPKEKHQLEDLRTVASTGSALAPRGFEWVSEAISPEVSVVSIAGGTDLCGCLVLGVPTQKVQPGEIQGPALGLDVTVLRADGSEADVLEDGELVCRTPFPTVPLRFWGDDDGSRIRASYFDRFEGIWAHGDHARRTPSGGFEILGRLDATLNAKGVRIGTAEIYRVVNSLEEITSSMAVAAPYDGDTRVVLFVVSKGELDENLKSKIRESLRIQASPRHVPALIVSAPALPVTRNGKLAELVVSDIVSGRVERDASSLANPECLDWFRDWSKENSS